MTNFLSYIIMYSLREISEITLKGSIKLQSLKVLDLYRQFFVSFENLITFNFNRLIR